MEVAYKRDSKRRRPNSNAHSKQTCVWPWSHHVNEAIEAHVISLYLLSHVFILEAGHVLCYTHVGAYNKYNSFEHESYRQVCLFISRFCASVFAKVTRVPRPCHTQGGTKAFEGLNVEFLVRKSLAINGKVSG
jgi:hypothetical protein